MQTWYLVLTILMGDGFNVTVEVPFPSREACNSAAHETSVKFDSYISADTRRGFADLRPPRGANAGE